MDDGCVFDAGSHALLGHLSVGNDVHGVAAGRELLAFVNAEEPEAVKQGLGDSREHRAEMLHVMVCACLESVRVLEEVDPSTVHGGVIGRFACRDERVPHTSPAAHDDLNQQGVGGDFAHGVADASSSQKLKSEPSRHGDSVFFGHGPDAVVHLAPRGAGEPYGLTSRARAHRRAGGCSLH